MFETSVNDSLFLSLLTKDWLLAQLKNKNPPKHLGTRTMLFWLLIYLQNKLATCLI